MVTIQLSRVQYEVILLNRGIVSPIQDALLRSATRSPTTLCPFMNHYLPAHFKANTAAEDPELKT